jgi:Zn-dependent protease
MIRIFQSGQADARTILNYITWLLGVAVAITVHEFAHAWRATKAGDPTPRSQGRLSLNPIAHYDPIGTTLFLLFGFGWAKPVPVNPYLFRHPRRDEIMVSLWGPLANFITAAVLAIPLRLGVAGPYTVALASIVQLQLLLAVFNLIPIYPLDGSHILTALLPLQQARRLEVVYRQYGIFLVMALVWFAGPVVWTVVDILRFLLIGG